MYMCQDLLKLCVRDTHRNDDNLHAGPRTTSAFEMIQAHGRHDPNLTAYFGASLLRAFRRDYSRAEIQPTRLTMPTKIPRMAPPRQPRTVLDYSDDDDFTVHRKVAVKPRKLPLREKNNENAIKKKLYQAHDDMLGRQGVIAQERAQQRLDTLQGPQLPVTHGYRLHSHQ